ncbi:hypothetical protein C6Q22_00145 [Burkholderia multivorans]|nr:Protein ChrB [Burkholderia multivorans]MDR8804984.1 Protein ChrB [Burkholderia multivorans]PRF97885.1 hypothetical protein C6Q22_00145 [Burkholderia multivorans]PRG66598.1 hypothetical protein C6T69_20025 [Burkholderia multivorans]
MRTRIISVCARMRIREATDAHAAPAGAAQKRSDLYTIEAVATCDYAAAMNVALDSWLLLIVSLPTSGATARMRIWRALKAIGCAALRDGAYLLPAHVEQASQLRALADDARREGGQSWLLDIVARDAEQNRALRALFDRRADFAAWRAELENARDMLANLGADDLARLKRRHARSYRAICEIDFFPDDAAGAADVQWRHFSAAIETRLSAGEPHSAAGAIARRDRSRHQGQRWATRRRLWADRVACAWLIQRFIDPHARFLWLDDPADCPADALGFDFDGATFTHVGGLVSFEVLLASFGLDDDRALNRIAALVHALDVGGTTAPEAGGFEAILAGARMRLPDDDALLREMSTVLDSLYAHHAHGTRASST